MKKEDLFEAIGEIDDRFVTENSEKINRRGLAAKRWIGLAACMVLAVAAVVGSFGSKWKNNIAGKDSYDDLLEPLVMAVYNNAYYEVVENKTILGKYQLPDKITEEMVGACLGEVKGAGEEPLGKFYRYLPYGEACDAVYLLSSDGIHYRFALFCNFIHPDDRMYEEAETLFALYGVTTGADIAHVTVDGETVTDPAEIEKIFTALCTAESMGNHDFQLRVFGRRSEEEQQQLSKELADNQVELRMVTRAGVVMKGIRYYKTIGYFEWSLNYYHTAEQ